MVYTSAWKAESRHSWLRFNSAIFCHKYKKDCINTSIIEVNVKNNDKYLKEELKNDKDIAKELINLNSFNFKYLSKELRNDKEIILSVISKDKSLICLSTEEIRNKCNEDNCIEVITKLIYEEKQNKILEKINVNSDRLNKVKKI